MNLKDSKDES